MRRLVASRWVLCVLLVLCALWVQSNAWPAAAQAPAQPQPTELTFEDQFERKASLADLRGAIVILVYGDRKSNELCKSVGESLHLCWHPTAKGQPPVKAQAAPVVPLDNLKAGQASPNVVVVPVACCGKVPGAIQKPIRTQIAKAVPDSVVWLDFGDTLKGMYGLTAGEPNLVVFDAEGRMRMKINGTPDQAAMDKLTQAVQDLRYEAVK
jgi:hypothetical protein